MDMVVHTCNPRVLEAKSEGSQVSGQLVLYIQFRASLNYVALGLVKWLKW
jgi:hypothetical protein